MQRRTPRRLPRATPEPRTLERTASNPAARVAAPAFRHASSRFARLQPQLVFADSPSSLCQRLVCFAQPPVAVVEAHRPFLELLLTLLDAPYLRRCTLDRIGSLALPSLDPRNSLCQPRSPFVEVRSGAIQRALTLVETKCTLLQHGDPFLRLAHVTQLVRELPLLDRQFRRAASKLPLALRMPGRTFLDLERALLEHSLSFLDRSKTRLQLRARLGEL